VLVSGGASGNGIAEASLMGMALANEFGLRAAWSETQSRNTHENAVNSSQLLRASGVKRVILVGHRFDFPRSRNEFEAAGIECIPAPIGVTPTEIDDFMPSPHGLWLSHYAVYELLANGLYWTRHFGASGVKPPAKPVHAAAVDGPM
jgi:uncharacterized SAM-binding protein YcdF (DUF218 family)